MPSRARPTSRGCLPSSSAARVNQRYAVIREEQARDFTLAWPVLRACVRRLGEHLAVDRHRSPSAEDVFFCTRAEVAARLAGHAEPLEPDALAERRQRGSASAAWPRR